MLETLFLPTTESLLCLPDSTPPPSSSPSSLAFLNLRYEVTSYSEYKWPKKVLLHRLNGSFSAGSLNALMGPSGSGKTTLLSILSGKSNSGLSLDSALYIGNTSTPSSYFVQQHIHETIEGALTVRQILEYAYLFKNGLGQKSKMEAHIAQITSKMLLNKPSLFDQPFSCCSGGEQRRVAIAQELMTLSPPSFLFLDEPTTGLDSYAALELIKCLAGLTKNTDHQLTIISSIHAPSSELLLHFSKLYVLAKGVCIFSGPPKQLKSVLEKQVGSVTKDEQPIETLIRIAGDDLDKSEQLQALANYTLENEYAAISTQISSLRSLPPSSGLPDSRKVFSLVDLYLLICRQACITFIAKKGELIAQLMYILGIIFAFSTLFNTPAMVLPDGCYTDVANLTENESETGLKTSKNGNTGLRDFILMENFNFQSFNRDENIIIVMLICSLLYSRLMAVFRSEHRNRWYSVGVFYWASDFILSLQIILFALFISAFSYFIVSEHAMDDYEVNWTRLGHFTACTLLYLAHTQALEISIAGYRLLSEALGSKHITRYLVYIFYGIDRCQGENEKSFMLERYDVEVEQLWSDLLWVVLLKTLLIKVATFALMYFRHASWNWKRSKFADSSFTLKKLQKLEFCLNNNVIFEQTTVNTVNQEQKFTEQKTIIAWRNVTLLKTQPLFKISNYTSIKRKMNTTLSPPAVLHNLNGSFTFNSLNAIMGMSGAGKTTFLRLLNGQHHQRLTEDSKFYLSNKVPLSKVFITQEVSGHLMKGLTAKQLLIYASKLKNIQHNVDHRKIALDLFDELNLADTADTKVEHLSGGEKKRLALALELTSVVMPNLICIDEPTSGLDSNSAELTISTLRTLTRSHPITIIVSIHQPNNQLLKLFDSLYVLASGGHAVYSGPPDEIESHLSLVQEKTFANDECSEYPIEKLVKYSSLKVETNAIVRQLETITRLATTTKEKEVNLKENTFLLENPSALSNKVRFSITSVFHLCSRYLMYTVGYQWKEFLPFSILYIVFALNIRLFFDPAIASVSGCVSIESENFNATSGDELCSVEIEAQKVAERLVLQNAVYTFFFSGFFLLISLVHTAPALLYELPHFANEHRNGYYSTGSWYLSKMIFEILPLLPVLALYVYIGNIYEGVHPLHKSFYWTIFGIIMLAVATVQGFVYIFFIHTNGHLITILVIALATMLIMVQLSNILASLASVHYAQKILAYFSVSRWPLQALIVLQYGFGRCAEREYHPLLYWMGLEDEDFTVAILWLLFNFIFFRGLSFWMLVRKVNSNGHTRRIVQKKDDGQNNV